LTKLWNIKYYFLNQAFPKNPIETQCRKRTGGLIRKLKTNLFYILENIFSIPTNCGASGINSLQLQLGTPPVTALSVVPKNKKQKEKISRAQLID